MANPPSAENGLRTMRVGGIKEERRHRDVHPGLESRQVGLPGHGLAAEQAVLVGPDEADDLDAFGVEGESAAFRGLDLLGGVEVVFLDELAAYWTWLLLE